MAEPGGALATGAVPRQGAGWVRALRRQPLLTVGLIILALFAVLAGFADVLAPYGPTEVRPADMLLGPQAGHLLGTDRFGRDLLSRIIYGTRVSLGIAAASIAVAAATGSLSGLVAGFVGGWVDVGLSRVMDLLLAFPSVLLALAIAAVLGAGVTNVIIAIAIVYTPMFFRVVRGSVLVEREQVYVEAAHAFGASRWWIMRRHVLRNVVSPIIVQTAISLSYAILLESAFSYLGVGVQPPTPSWGTILNEGREFIELAPWISIFPGIFIMLAVLAFNFISDGLRDMMDPRLRKL